jgi:hypothetical protein
MTEIYGTGADIANPAADAMCKAYLYIAAASTPHY